MAQPNNQRQTILDRLTSIIAPHLSRSNRRRSPQALGQNAGDEAVHSRVVETTRSEPASGPSTATRIPSPTGEGEEGPALVVLPGLANLTISNLRNGPLCSLPPPQGSSAFTPRPPKEPDLLIQRIPADVQFAIFDYLALGDLMALRSTCRALRGAVPLRTLERALTGQNYAGWSVVFEVNGKSYPGTTYGNRRLCGRCVVPKTRAHLIEGKDVSTYLTKRGVKNAEWDWPADRGMCFPCLWTLLAPPAADNDAKKPQTEDAEADSASVKQQASSKGTSKRGKGRGSKSKPKETRLVNAPPAYVEVEIWQSAAISPLERFRMLDGTTRRSCERCARDVHENAVPCPFCVDFSEWCRSRNRADCRSRLI